MSMFAMGVAYGLWRSPCKPLSAGQSGHLGFRHGGRLVQRSRGPGGRRHHRRYPSLHHVRLRTCYLAIGVSDAGGARSFVSKLTAENPTHLSAYLPADHETYPWHGVILGLGLVITRLLGGWPGDLARTLGARTQWDASAGMILLRWQKLSYRS